MCNILGYMLIKLSLAWSVSTELSLVRGVEVPRRLPSEKVTSEQIAMLPAYRFDIFSFLSELSLSLQGRMASVYEVSAFKAELELWRQEHI